MSEFMQSIGSLLFCGGFIGVIIFVIGMIMNWFFQRTMKQLPESNRERQATLPDLIEAHDRLENKLYKSFICLYSGVILVILTKL